MPGIVENIKTASSEAEVQSLVAEAKRYEKITSKTLNRVNRFADKRLKELARK